MPDDGLTAHDVFHVLEYATDVVRQPSEREKSCPRPHRPPAAMRIP
jgi:hypothetical protein